MFIDLYKSGEILFIKTTDQNCAVKPHWNIHQNHKNYVNIIETAKQWRKTDNRKIYGYKNRYGPGQKDLNLKDLNSVSNQIN